MGPELLEFFEGNLLKVVEVIVPGPIVPCVNFVNNNVD